MSWSKLLPQETLDLCDNLLGYDAEIRKSGKYKLCPSHDDILRALKLTPPEKTRVVIVGQDPYHTPGIADGLAFSCKQGIQPSLRNILNETCGGCPAEGKGDLSSWAEQGVLLLNTTLTVKEHQPNSCANWGWKNFTYEVLSAATRLPQPVVFMLWGASAYNLVDKLISCAAVYDKENGLVLERLIKKAYICSSHPSPFSASRPSGGWPAFKGSKPFAKANNLLISMGGEPIDWSL